MTNHAIRRMKAAVLGALAIAALLAGSVLLLAGPSSAATTTPTGMLRLTLGCTGLARDGSGSDEVLWSVSFHNLPASTGVIFLTANSPSGNKGTAQPEIPVDMSTDSSGAIVTAPTRAVNVDNTSGGSGPLFYYVGDAFPWTLNYGGPSPLAGTAVVTASTGCSTTTPTPTRTTTTPTPTRTTATVSTTPTHHPSTTTSRPSSASSGGGTLAETGTRTTLLVTFGTAAIALGLLLLAVSRRVAPTSEHSRPKRTH